MAHTQRVSVEVYTLSFILHRSASNYSISSLITLHHGLRDSRSSLLLHWKYRRKLITTVTVKDLPKGEINKQIVQAQVDRDLNRQLKKSKVERKHKEQGEVAIRYQFYGKKITTVETHTSANWEHGASTYFIIM
ncbi:uncharacterized protein LOC107870309 [Capsicum annuum]|uniref:uncharacterized protein LOC107870309 n=1 Tax=Capsicum annuum TaxID=4072 RepID=UPI0007BF2269|nr:uncharacterized protein LOC107870309 [Capsicum annuum]XP_016572286.1 uncharacterized protein LOC107870309 [Capsicum annuum]